MVFSINILKVTFPRNSFQNNGHGREWVRGWQKVVVNVNMQFCDIET
jgi:hypothetical protein